MATAETSRSYTISLPLRTAELAEELALRESITISELVDEALRTYQAEPMFRTLADIGEFAASLHSKYTEEDVPRLIKDVRAEEAAKRTSHA